MFRFLKVASLTIGLLAPFTLHSTDIYISSGNSVKIRTNLNSDIIPGDGKLGSTVLVVTTPRDMGEFRIESACEHRDSVLYRDATRPDTISIIQVNFPNPCESLNLSIASRENIFTDATLDFPATSVEQMKRELVNTSSDELLSIMNSAEESGIYSSGTTMGDKLKTIQSIYRNAFLTKKSGLAREILEERNNFKYISPVAEYSLPTQEVRMPGAGRGYRADTTDGIHHGWDIYTPYGTPVQSLAHGTVIRIVNDWAWSRFDDIVRSNPSSNDRLNNLDIFRGNQVWLQTIDGNVTFYSHLSKISPDIHVGSEVTQGTYLGNIGITWVPDKDYPDVHLHFEVQENPYAVKNPTTLDIMRWDYAGKGLTKSEVSRKMKEMFR